MSREIKNIGHFGSLLLRLVRLASDSNTLLPHVNRVTRTILRPAFQVMAVIVFMPRRRWILKNRQTPFLGEENKAGGKTSFSAASPVETRTETGAKVIDRRRVSIPSQPLDFVSNKASSIAEDKAENDQEGSSTRNFSAFLFAALGSLTLFLECGPRRTSASRIDIGRTAWNSLNLQTLLLNRKGEDWVAVAQTINELEPSKNGDWRLALILWVRSRFSQVELAHRIHGDITSPLFNFEDLGLFTIYLKLAKDAISSYSTEQASEILSVALIWARKNINPYEPSGHKIAARSLVQGLLEQRPELDERIFSTLKLQAHDAELPSATLPIEIQLLAVALRNRANGVGTTFANAILSANFDMSRAESVARLADSTVAPTPIVHSMGKHTARRALSTLWLQRFTPWLVPPTATAALVIATRELAWPAIKFSLGMAEAIAILALLVTVNVFTVQLSASRLPGIIARNAGRPWQLLFSYSSALTLLTIVGAKEFLSDSFPDSKEAIGWGSLFAFVLSIGSLLPAMFLLLRMTDAARASANYLTAMASFARATGRDMGRIQAKAILLNSSLDSFPAATVAIDTTTGEWRTDILGRRRGFFSPSIATLRKLLNRKEFMQGMRLQLIAGVGTIVDSGVTVASLIPPKDRAVSDRLVKAANRVFSIRSSRRIEDLASGSVALTQISLDLARTGDTGTAHAVAQNALRLLSQHLSASREARISTIRSFRIWSGLPGAGTNIEDDIAPANPALRDVVRIVVHARLSSEHDRLDILETFIRPIFSMTLADDAAGLVATFGVPQDIAKIPAGIRPASELLRLAGVRALELRSRMLFNEVLNRLASLGQEKTCANQVANTCSELAATAAAFNPRWSIYATRIMAKLLTGMDGGKENPMSQLHARLLWRIGSAGLTCGAISVALNSAKLIWLGGKYNSVMEMASDEDVLSYEEAHSKMQGGYLGRSPKDSLATCGTFLSQLRPLLEMEEHLEISGVDSEVI